MPLVLPNLNLVASGALLDGDVLHALFVAIQNKFNSAIVGTDVSAAAAIPGTAIAANSLPGDRVVNGSIGNAQLGAQSVANTNVQDATLQKAKLSTTVGQRIARAQLDLSIYTQTAAPASIATPFAILITPSTAFPVATYECLGAFLKTWTPNLSVAPTIVPIDTGANWTFNLVQSVNVGNAGFTFVAIFIPKV